MPGPGHCRTISLVGVYLDLAGAPFKRVAGTLRLDPERLADFNAVLRAISPDAPSVDAALLEQMARELGAGSHDGPASVQRRLEQIEGFKRMAADPAWRLPGEDAGRIDLALDYLARPDDLIPDETPAIGLLDDAIVIELARRALARELDEYAAFCRFREAEAAVRGVPVARVEVDRRDWLAWKRSLRELDAGRGIEPFAGSAGDGAFRVR